MKSYPTIPREPQKSANVWWVFDKLDGSNIRVEWNKKQGFFKFGSRKRLLGTDQGIISEAEHLVVRNGNEGLAEYFKKQGWDRVVCFFEFLGEHSFAGVHYNETHRVYLFDVWPYKQPMINPKQFLDLISHCSILSPSLLHVGPIDSEFTELVTSGTLEGMSFEGVVCKAFAPRKWDHPLMYKIKNHAWVARVKQLYGESCPAL